MKSTHRTLSQFLATLDFTEKKLKQLTGITIPRLRAIYKHGTFTDDEIIKLIKALTGRRAVEMAFASQIGNFNQNGIGNKQTIINNFFTIVMRRLGAIPGFQQPHMLPAKPVLVGLVQQRLAYQIPGSQVATIMGVLVPDNRNF